MFIYRQSRTEFWSFKEIQLPVNALPQPHSFTVNALPQPHSSTQHTLMFLSGDWVKALWPTYLSGCDDVIKDSGVIRFDDWVKRLNTDWFYRYDTRFAQEAPLSVIYSRVSSHETPLPGHHSKFPKFRRRGDVGPFAVVVSLAGLEWPTVSTFVMAFICVTKITEWHPL